MAPCAHGIDSSVRVSLDSTEPWFSAGAHVAATAHHAPAAHTSTRPAPSLESLLVRVPAVVNHMVDKGADRCRVRSTEWLRKGLCVSDQLSRVFAALADETRRDIVTRLADEDATVGELAEPYDMSLQAVSKHLKVLEGAGVVTSRREAQRRHVHLEAEVFDLMDGWIERYRRRAEERYQRLDALLAQETETDSRKGGAA